MSKFQSIKAVFGITVIVCVTIWATKIFSSPSVGAVSDKSAALISTLDLQRELNRLYPEAKLKEDGICGKATQYWWNWDSFNRNALELWPEKVK